MKKNIDLIWSVSLIAVDIATIIWSGSKLLDIELSDTVTLIILAVELLGLPFLLYSSIMKKKATAKK